MERVFPTAFWENTRDGNGYAAELLRKAGERLGIRERLSWNPEARLLRLLGALRAGVEAERKSMVQRADFYLGAAHFEFESLAKNGRFWDAMKAKAGGADMRRAIAAELLLETHMGFTKGYLLFDPVQAGGDRASRHVAWAERVLPFAGLGTGEQSAVRAWLHWHEIEALERAGKREAALSLYERMLESSSPAAFKDGFIECLCAHATGETDGGEPADQRNADAAALASSIARFSRSFDRISDRPLAFERLAELHRRRIAELAETEDPGPRMAAFQRAIDADPFDLETQATDVQSRFALADYQEKLAQLEVEANADGKVLNEKGLSLKLMFTSGFAGVRAYLASNEAKAVQSGIQSLTARRIWRSLQLATDEGWEARSLDLADAIGAALVEHDLEHRGFAGALRTAMEAKPDIAALDAAAIAAGLKALRGAMPPPEAHAARCVPALVQAVDPLKPAQDSAAPGAEDFSDWFFSHRAKGTRWATAAASVLLIAAGGLTAYNAKVSADREALYPQIMAAAREDRHEAVVELAAKFLSARPLSGRGSVDESVEQAYAESLVTLIAQSPSEPAPSLVQAAQRYSRLVGGPKGGRQ